jgi:protein-tyrosine phosphatase
MRVLFVCLGNICRSPSAEGVFQTKIDDAGLEGRILCDSAGTAGYHSGALPDGRMMEHAESRGVKLESRARQFTVDDFEASDLILVMDEANRSDVMSLANDAGLGADSIAKVKMMMAFADSDLGSKYPEVPDPYYGGPDGFKLVLDLLDNSCENLLQKLRVDIGE